MQLQIDLRERDIDWRKALGDLERELRHLCGGATEAIASLNDAQNTGQAAEAAMAAYALCGGSYTRLFVADDPESDEFTSRVEAVTSSFRKMESAVNACLAADGRRMIDFNMINVEGGAWAAARGYTNEH
jgi:hypothetical protein